MEDKNAFEYLLQQYLSGELTETERIQFLKSLNDNENIQKLSSWIEAYSNQKLNEVSVYDKEKVNEMIRDILERSSMMPGVEAKDDSDTPDASISKNESTEGWDYPVGSHRRLFGSASIWIRYVAAAVVVGIGLFFYVQYRKNIIVAPEALPPLVQAENEKDVLPGSNKAILTLSDGKKVELDDKGTQVINDGEIAIRTNEGAVAYGKSAVVVYNTMTTPRGGQFKLKLPDGTMVWLNAESSITYPTAFPGGTRQVEITGEAYFEVAKNAAKPFIVKTYKDEITVKGTSFNVNSYDDESGIKTSLLEGLVQINGMQLTPGKAYVDGRIIATDLNKDLAWKNGVFSFHQVKLKQAMRQLARWYDVEVKYESNLDYIELGGEIGRNLSLQQVLRGLQDKDLHFRLEGRVLTVY